MIKDFLQKNRLAMIFSVLASLFYFSIVLIYYPKTTIFFNNGQFDVLFDTDTGVIFKGDWFYGTAADIRHFLFRNFMSPFIFPIKVLLGSDVLAKHPTVYGIYIAFIQIVFMSVNTFIILKLMKDFGIAKWTRILLGLLFITAWQQIFFSVNLERYFLGQFSLLFFLLLVHLSKTKSMIVNGLAGILLIGTTVTNIYLFFANLVVAKMSLIKKLLHVLVFGILFYYVLLFGGGGGQLLSASGFLGGYTDKFTEKYPLIELPGKIFTNLFYSSIFPPNLDRSVKDAFFQSSHVDLIPAILVGIILIVSFYTIWKMRNNPFVLLLGFVLLGNLVLHGFVQFGLRSAAMYTNHFNFVFYLLIGFFSTLIPADKRKWFYAFLGVWLVVSLYQTTNLFIEIYQLGITAYGR
ncbi:hypothetical protein [Falsibacillus pallidus]|uniref:hypothetical protein n=1 Tax=Falsibacillus pallidus TaxID=493781 RepID=UPI003D965FBC